MSLYGNRKTLIEPQGAQLSWDWSGVAGDDDLFPKGTVSKPVPGSSRVSNDSTPTHTTFQPLSNGTKRTLGGTMNLNGLVKKQKTHQTGISSRPAQKHDANVSTLGRAYTIRPSKTRPINMPFSIDESSSEDGEPTASTRPQIRVPSPFQIPAPKALPKELSKAEQQAMSKKLREEACARRAAFVAPSSSRIDSSGSGPIRDLPVTSDFKQHASRPLRGENERTRRLETSRRLREETNKKRVDQRVSRVWPPSSTHSPVRRTLDSPFRPSTREEQSYIKEPEPANRVKPTIISLDTDDEEEDELDLMATIKKTTGSKTYGKSFAPAGKFISKTTTGASTITTFTDHTKLRVSSPSTSDTAGAPGQTVDAVLQPVNTSMPQGGQPPALQSSGSSPPKKSKANLSAHLCFLPDGHDTPQKAHISDDKDAAKVETGRAETEHDKQHRLKTERNAVDQKLQLELEQKQQVAKQRAEADRKTVEENRAKEEEQTRHQQRREQEQQRLQRVVSQEQRRLREEAVHQQALKSQQEELVALKAQARIRESLKKQEAARKEREAASIAEAAKKEANQDFRAEEALSPEAREALRKKEVRIRKQQERNESLHNEDHNSDGELVMEEPAPAPAVLTPKPLATVRGEIEQQQEEDARLGSIKEPKPISLNSAAGVRAVEESTQANTEPAKPGTLLKLLGLIMPEDAAITHWRDTGHDWSTIVNKYEDMTKKRRAEYTLKKRYYRVRKALNQAHIDPVLIRQLMVDDANARQQVNLKVHGEGSVPTRTSAVDAAVFETNKLARSAPKDVQSDSHKGSPSSGQHKGHSCGLTSRSGKVRSQKVAENLQGGHTILPIDAMLFCWRQEGLDWAAISRLYEKSTGRQRSQHALRCRYRESKEILDNAEIEQDLIDSLANEDSEAQHDIKRWIEHYQNGLTNRVDTVDDKKRGSLVNPPGITPQSSFTASNSYRAFSASPAQRPTTGGKQLTVDNLWTFMGDQADVWQERDEGFYQPSEIDSDDPADYEYNVYRVARKECTLQEQEAGVNVDAKPWTYDVQEYEDLEEANAAAYRESILTFPGHTDYHQGPYNQRSGFDKRGCRSIRIDNDTVGTLMIAVDRHTRTYRERILPKTKDHWKPHFFYVVHSRTEDPKNMVEILTEEVDEVLGETVKVVSKYTPILVKPVAGTATYALEQANRRAASEFAKLTSETSGNLSWDDETREGRIEGLLKDWEEYGEGEEAVFESGEIGKRGVKVWVERVGVSGARN